MPDLKLNPSTGSAISLRKSHEGYYCFCCIIWLVQYNFKRNSVCPDDLTEKDVHSRCRVHDFGALFASIRHNGQSLGEVIGDTMGNGAKKLFTVFGYLVLLLVVAAFTSIVASTFGSTNASGAAIEGQNLIAHQQTAMP